MFGAAWNAAAGRATRPNAASETAKWLHARRFPGEPSLVRVASVFLLPLDMIFQLDTFPPQLLINAARMITP
jgi:hypothetical protein